MVLPVSLPTLDPLERVVLRLSSEILSDALDLGPSDSRKTVSRRPLHSPPSGLGVDLVPGRGAPPLEMTDELREVGLGITGDQDVDMGRDGADGQDPRAIAGRDRTEIWAAES